MKQQNEMMRDVLFTVTDRFHHHGSTTTDELTWKLPIPELDQQPPYRILMCFFLCKCVPLMRPRKMQGGLNYKINKTSLTWNKWLSGRGFSLNTTPWL